MVSKVNSDRHPAKSQPIALGISGASGTIYAVRSLKFLLANGYHVELVASKAAIMVWQSEHEMAMPVNPKQQEQFWRDRCEENGGALNCHAWSDVGANLASGSFRTMGMVVIPCSMATVAKIAQGLSSDLLERAADVHIKEGRKLVVVPRETPFSLIHLRNLTALAEAGVRIVPAIPAWYHQPRTIEDLVDFVIARVFDQLDIDSDLIQRWQGRSKP
ncbi:flavin prenyltransferase UbiX [Pseudanabaena sp. PCC 6802]|uniref:flavin prenyltransferase UbiX n=1 Tax=Pseudanabaena sp. PCC 6802 TaxID=118173 RepID=UPI00034494FB|nr:flavin prenyltransferase UbiX [Pseudanabaena sp. PCC 6802]